MTLEIGLVLAILATSLVLFVSEKIRMDLIALLVLGTLVLTGLVTASEAVAGFSNAAVIAVWAMFILSDGLTRTGIANVIGRTVLRLAGRRESRMVIVIMVTSGGLSAFMNNIGVAALMLPVVIDVARRTRIPASRLLMPLAYGSLLDAKRKVLCRTGPRSGGAPSLTGYIDAFLPAARSPRVGSCRTRRRSPPRSRRRSPSSSTSPDRTGAAGAFV